MALRHRKLRNGLCSSSFRNRFIGKKRDVDGDKLLIFNHILTGFNIIFIMRTNIVVAKLRCQSLSKLVSPQRSLLAMDETHDGIRNGVFFNELCKPTQNPSGCYRPCLTTRLVTNRLEISDRHCRRLTAVVVSLATGNCC